MDLTRRVWTGFTCSGQKPVAAHCEHGTEPSGPIKCSKCLDMLKNYQLLKDFLRWSKVCDTFFPKWDWNTMQWNPNLRFSIKELRIFMGLFYSSRWNSVCLFWFEHLSIFYEQNFNSYTSFWPQSGIKGKSTLRVPTTASFFSMSQASAQKPL